jgi:hypothetical protein
MILGMRFKHRLFVLRRILLSSMYRLLGPLNTYLQPKKSFCIKAGYHAGKNSEIFDDRANRDQWQSDVYESSLSFIKKMNGKSVMDVGCGSAFKLVEKFGNYETTGIELSDMCHWLLTKYPTKKWLPFEFAEPRQLQSDLIICSDVIEHVKNPDELMDFLKKINFKFLVISTPERNRVRGSRDFGPPENTSHYREWNDLEFNEYVSKWFKVKDQIISNDRSVSQILFCTPMETAS